MKKQEITTKNSINHTKSIKNLDNLKKNDINYKKSLGQNFIYDTNLLNAIVSDADIHDDDVVLEIGAGAGTLTSILASRASRVISFEIDRSLSEILNDVKNRHANVEFYFQDFMECDIDELTFERAKVVANIPYYITTPIVFKLIDKIEKFDMIMLLVQKEVAERFASSNGSKEYGITSVILQSLFDVKITRVVRKEAFTPMPKIDSAVVKMVPHKKYNITNFDEFRAFIHQSFSMRRKTLVNNLKSKYDKEIILNSLKSLNLNENIRPEQISVKEYVLLFDILKN